MFARLLFGLLLAAPVLHAAEPGTPEAAVLDYFDLFRRGDMTGIAERLHDDEATRFKADLLPLIERTLTNPVFASSRETAAVRDLLDGETLEDLKAEPPHAFFTRYMRWVLRRTPGVIDALKKTSIEPLGHIREDDIAHVVCRITVETPDTRARQMKLLSVRLQGETWRFMVSGDLQTLPAPQ
jgi:hypothetical protein